MHTAVILFVEQFLEMHFVKLCAESQSNYSAVLLLSVYIFKNTLLRGIFKKHAICLKKKQISQTLFVEIILQKDTRGVICSPQLHS